MFVRDAPNQFADATVEDQRVVALADAWDAQLAGRCYLAAAEVEQMNGGTANACRYALTRRPVG